MLEKPTVQGKSIITCLQNEYNIEAKAIVFLPLGADANTAVYRVRAGDGISYFLKLRKGAFDPTSVLLPKYLSDQGIKQIIPPLLANSGELWGTLDVYRTILYPFIEGCNACEADLSTDQWRELGAALKRIHLIPVPDAITSAIRREDYSSRFRDLVRVFLSQIDSDAFIDPVATELASFMRQKRDMILNLVERAEALASALRTLPLSFIVCHSDLHAGNLFVAKNGALYIVDWDEPVLAPRERDLMYIGGGLLDSGLAPQAEETLFYRAYGETYINSQALAYYRCERIVQDIAAFAEQLLLTDEGGADRKQSLAYFKSNFMPGGTIELAYRPDL